MAVLDGVADRQAQWSTTADALKATIDRARLSAFALSIVGALGAALASQITDSGAGQLRSAVAIAAAICLAAATFFTARLLGAGQVTAWVRARAIAERLKREAFLYAAAASPYDVPATRKS